MNLIGLDLGQQNDPAAMCLLTRREFPVKALPTLPVRPQEYGPKKPPPLDWDKPFVSPQEASDRRYREMMKDLLVGDAEFDADILDAAPKVDKQEQQLERRYLCRGLKKWPLGTSYVKVVHDVRLFCGQQRLQVDVNGKIARPCLIVDATGLGAPVVDMFRASKVPAHLIAISITGGERITVDPEREWHFMVPKHILVNTLQVLMQSDRIDFVPNMIDKFTGENMQEALEGELADFRAKNKNSGGGKVSAESLEAEEGSHDDLLMAVSYAAWYGERGGRTPKIW